MQRLLSLSWLLLVPLAVGCNAFDSQCDHLDEQDEQLECLDSAFMALRSDADRCYRGERGGDEASRAERIEEYCEGLEEDDDNYERCQRALGNLDGLHERTRSTVERSDDSDERGQTIRSGLREGRGLAGCDRDRQRSGEAREDCAEGETLARGDLNYTCVEGTWVQD